MKKLATILLCCTIVFGCQNDSQKNASNNLDCSTTIYDELENLNHSIQFYPKLDTFYFKPSFSDFDSILIAINCLNIYDSNCWKAYRADSILLVNRSLEPNGWADGPFSVYIPDKIKEVSKADPSAKRNNLDKLNVIRFQIFDDSSHYEQVFHIGVGIHPPSNYITTIDYEDLSDMIGPKGNYGVGDGFHSHCDALDKKVDVNVNYIVHSSKNPLYKCAGMTRCFVEKPVLFSVYDTAQTQIIQQHVGSSLSCNGSAHFPAKGLQVVARGRYGDKKMEANFFESKEEFKNVRVRLGGSGQFSPPCQHVMDAIGHDLYAERGLRNQFTSLYLNGSQWGVGYLQEKLDEHFVEKHYGFNEEFVDVLEIVGMRNSGLICQDSALIHQLNKDNLLDSLGYHDYMSYADNFCWLATVKDGNGKAFSKFYKAALSGDFSQLDTESLFDYLAHVDFITSSDPGRSSMFFCSDRRDPIWYAQAVDFDYAFNEDPTTNYWFVILKTSDRDPFREIVRKFFEKEENRIAFIKRYQDLLNTRYSLEVVIPKVAKRLEEFAQEVESQEYAWEPNALDAEMWLQNCYEQPYLQNYLITRYDAVKYHLATMFMGETGFGIEDQQKLIVKMPNIELSDSTYIQINSLKIQEDFEGLYFPWPSVNVSIHNLPEGYECVGWKGKPQEKQAHLNFFMDQKIELEPILKKR